MIHGPSAPHPLTAPHEAAPRETTSARSTARVGRDELRRRLLAVADTLAAAGASASLVVAPAGGAGEAFWAFVIVPLWIVLARIHGLYDRDERSLRHLSIDELPEVFLWALTATGAVAVTLLLTPAGSVHIGAALQLWFTAATTALLLRALARFLWRRST
ncbi:MAG: hypothetical protein ACRDOP_03700, partial [Gaiellaceae bacterium]